MNKRIFISHASEDKLEFVAPLANELINASFDVWYDEYEIKPGLSIRQSIDRGLICCDIGLIVLSRNYFNKQWTQLELNAYFSKMTAGQSRIIPIWYKVNKQDILNFSPLLVDILGIDGSLPMKEIISILSKAIYPQETTLQKARRLIEAKGLDTPDFSDDWWIKVAQFSEQYNIFTPWYFPVSQEESHELFQKLAWNALKLNWLNKYSNLLNQFTSPNILLNIIENAPGMKEAVQNDYLATYAPQLLFCDNYLGSNLKQRALNIKRVIKQPDKSYICKLTNDGKIPSQNRIYALLEDDFGGYKSGYLLQHFVEGENFGIRPSFLSYWEVLILLNTKYSRIYPEKVITVLLNGFKTKRNFYKLKERLIQKDSLNKIFENIDLLKQVCSEICEDSLFDYEIDVNDVANKIFMLNISKSLEGEVDYRITISNDDLTLGFRGITFQKKYAS